MLNLHDAMVAIISLYAITLLVKGAIARKRAGRP
jgi:hypothetical protein